MQVNLYNERKTVVVVVDVMHITHALTAFLALNSPKQLGLHVYNTHTVNGPFSGTTQVSRYQKSKTNLDFTEARDRE